MVLAWALGGCLVLPGLTQAAAEAAAPESSAPVVGKPLAVDPVELADTQATKASDSLLRQQRELVDLRMRLAAAESASGWLPGLFLGLVGLGGLAVWLGLRVRRLQRDKARREWAAAEAELHASLRPDASGSGPSPLLPGDAPLLSAAPAGSASAVTTPELAMARADLLQVSTGDKLPALSRAERTLSPLPDAKPRAVTVEEMLDLEQQVDFFVVLGQEEAAIDLLLGHVRSTGGINAMPYIKLLEIYRQQGDEEAYERTRERFNQRFNAVAPPFGEALMAGRQLEQYPELVTRLQRAWQQPIRALAELDSLLLRRADLEPLDLPAFHDLLTLHALVRDLPASVPGVALAAAPAAVAAAAQPAASAALSPAIASALASARAGLNPDRTQTVLAVRRLPAEPTEGVDLLLPMDAEAPDVTQPRPRLAEPSSTRALVADWMQTRSTVRADALTLDARLPAEPVARASRLDLDLSEISPPPREFTRPGALSDIGLRRDTRPSDLQDFDDSDLLPPSITRR